jgi:hypothetical protein
MASDREVLHRYYTREEEFLNEFGSGGIVSAVNKAISPDEWRANYHCNDAERQQRDYFRKTGELSSLVFDGAAVYHTAAVFSSAQVILRTAKRIVTVQVKAEDEQLVGEKMVDEPA